MAKPYCEKIEKIKKIIDKHKDNISLVIKNYKNNINTINNKVNGASTTTWKDDVQTEYSSYMDNLKNGIVYKFNASQEETGSLTTFEQLLKDLEEKCNDYLKVISSNSGYTYVFFDKENNNFFRADTVFREESTPAIRDNINVSELNTQFSKLVTSINDILKKLKELRFESVSAYESTKDYDFSNTGQENNSKKRRELPKPKGHKFESPDDAWVLLYDNTKTYMERKKDDLTGIMSPDKGEHQLWAYNKVSGELVPIDTGYDFSLGFLESTYTFNLPDGKTIKTHEYEGTYSDVITHIKNDRELSKTVEDKWVLTFVNGSREANQELFQKVEEETGKEIPQSFVLPNNYVFYNSVTGETVTLSNVNIEDSGDKYIIKNGKETYIVYKDNYVEWNLDDYQQYQEELGIPSISAVN